MSESFKCEECDTLLFPVDEQNNKYWCALCSKEVILKRQEPILPELQHKSTQQVQPAVDDDPFSFGSQPTSELSQKIEAKKAKLSATFKSVESEEDEEDSQPPTETKLTMKSVLIGGGVLLLLLSLCGIVLFLFFSKPDKKQEVVVTETEKVRVWETEEVADYSEALSFAKECLALETEEELLTQLLPVNGLDEILKGNWSKISRNTDLQYQNVYFLEAGYLGYVFIQPSSNAARRVVIYRSPGDEYYWDWLSYVGIQDVDINDLSSLPVGEEVLVRASLEAASYYNFGYTEREWGSFILKNNVMNDKYLKPVNAFFNKEVMKDSIYELNSSSVKLLRVKWTGKTVEVVSFVSAKPTVYSFDNFSLPLLENE